MRSAADRIAADAELRAFERVHGSSGAVFRAGVLDVHGHRHAQLIYELGTHAGSFFDDGRAYREHVERIVRASGGSDAPLRTRLTARWS